MVGIPNDQLTTWAEIGAQTTSKNTYATVKLALEKEGTTYHRKAPIFLQGSYGNDTNIFKESDVDVVIRLDSIFTYDVSALPPPQSEALKAAHPDAKYTHVDFKRDVLKVLDERFGRDVEPGEKAVFIRGRNDRRDADVLVAVQHRRYIQYTGSVATDRPVVGIAFHKADGKRVINYPVQHRENLTVKNQETNEWFKHLVRIFKNARQKLIEQGALEEGDAPSYYVEGLLYNVPSNLYGGSYAASMEKILRWLLNADHTKFKCPNDQYPLFDANPDVTWNSGRYGDFRNGLIAMWDNW
jgi:hypothetical protein